MRASVWTQLRLLLWKNWTLQKRRPVATAIQILVPIILFLLLWALRSIITLDTYPDTVYCSQATHGLDYGRFYLSPDYGPQPPDVSCDSNPPILGRWIGENPDFDTIAYAPDSDPQVNAIMQGVHQRLQTFFGITPKMYPFANEQDLLLNASTTETLGLAVLFYADVNGKMGGLGFSPSNVHYVMRMPESLASDALEGWGTDRLYPEFEGLGPDVRTTYVEDSGFVYFQTTLDRSILSVLKGDDLPFLVPRIAPLPWPAYSSDGFIYVTRGTIPFVLVVSFVYSVTTLVRQIVYEKEKRLKEAMAMMGLSSQVHWAAWFIRAFVMFFLSIVVMMIIFAAGNFTEYSQKGIVFIFLLLFVISTIAFCFLISSLFSKASSAAAAGGLLFFLAYCPYFYVESRFDAVPSSDKGGFCLLSPTCVGIGAYVLAHFESSGEGLSFSNLSDGPTEKDSFSMADVFGMLILDTVLYLLLTWYITNVMPGEFGLKRPFYFFLTRSYWCGSTHDEDQYTATNTNDDPNLFEPLPKSTPAGLKIRNLCKVFKAETGGQKVAVDGLTFDAAEDQITALLGHNGAGKTTTMSILVGLYQPTSGTATINGHDITTDMAGARQSLGLCPQFDVLFDSLTFAEHIIFFSRLKGLSVEEARQEVETYAKDLDLEEKIDERVDTLSGGQRRAVSIAIALCGGSKVVFLDEPTSGMDPFKRRHTWDLLLKHKRGRTMVLTTHFMEEADLLGDRIAIMAAGKLRTMGSSLFLKSKFGVGYHMTVVKEPNCDVGGLNSVITRHVADAAMVTNVGTELTFVLPQHGAPAFPAMFEDLDAAQSTLGFSSYGVSVTTMEEVFLKVAEGNVSSSHEEDKRTETAVLLDENKEIPTLDAPELVSGPILLWSQFRAMITKRALYSARNKWAVLTQLVVPLLFATAALAIAQIGEQTADSPLLPFDLGIYSKAITIRVADVDTAGDYRSWLDDTTQRQVASLGSRASSVKDQTYTALENYLGNVPNVLLETFAMANMSSVLLDASRSYESTRFFDKNILSITMETGAHYLIYDEVTDACGILRPDITVDTSSALKLQLGQTYTFLVYNATNVFFSASPNNTDEGFGLSDGSPLKISNVFGRLAVTLEVTTDLVNNLASELYIFCGTNSLSETGIPLMLNATESTAPDSVNLYVGYTPRALHAAPQGLNVIANALARAFVSNSTTIHAYNQPLPVTASEAADDIFNDPIGLNLAIFLVFASGFLMASFALFVLLERVNKAKHVQFVSGVHFAVFWSASYLWDWVTMFVPAVGLVIIMALFNLDAYRGHYHLVFQLFIMLAFAAIPLIYCLSFLFSTPSGSYAAISISFVMLGLGGLIGVFVSTALDEPDVADTLRHVFLLVPNYAFGQGLYDIWLNSQLGDLISMLPSLCDASSGGSVPEFCTQYQSKFNAWEPPGIGQPILYMFLSGLFWFGVLLLFESGLVHRPRVAPASLSHREEDTDVAAERARVEGAASTDGSHVVVKSLTKTFVKKDKRLFTAVDNLSFGIPEGECFGLLGVNGAGKTTTFRMLTGEIRPSKGTIQIAGHDLETEMNAARQQLGYCPQFDALIGLLTGREHLRMYARLRGVPEHQIDAVVADLIRRLGLTEHADKPSYTYSGGNKRKLSTAIALVGNPSIVLLDEPTTGMDPQARRFLWSVLARVTARRQSIILTSHSMEECEALCQRLAIMVNGRFKCIGSVGHLKHRFGRGYSLQARVKLDANNMAPDTTALKAFIEESFRGAILKEEHNGAVTYRIEAETRSWSYMFSKLEEAKTRFNLDDYGLSQVSLEQVFLRFAAEQHEDAGLRNGFDTNALPGRT
eukprot:m.132210 g.132210  ORF g.132210 m.132210 type:complete len:1829 (+) comp15771_c0_seq2:231-5717(+)